jgi:D-alanine transaminase
MENLGYYNGKFAPIDEMTVPMNDRVCFFGDGVYDATYSRNHKIFALDDHIDRFYNSAALLKINISASKDEMKALLQEMVRKVDDPEQFVYWQVTRGTAQRNHSFPAKDVKSNIWIILKPKKINDIHKKVKLIIREDIRFLWCNIKTLNLIPSVMAAQEAAEAGCDECVFYRNGRVTECAHSNVSIIKDGAFVTAPADRYILPGITRKHLIAFCEQLDIPIIEKAFTVEEMMNADEVIVSSSGQLCLQAVEIEGKQIGGKAPDILSKLQDAYLKRFYDETEK